MNPIYKIALNFPPEKPCSLQSESMSDWQALSCQIVESNASKGVRIKACVWWVRSHGSHSLWIDKVYTKILLGSFQAREIFSSIMETITESKMILKLATFV